MRQISKIAPTSLHKRASSMSPISTQDDLQHDERSPGDTNMEVSNRTCLSGNSIDPVMKPLSTTKLIIQRAGPAKAAARSAGRRLNGLQEQHHRQSSRATGLLLAHGHLKSASTPKHEPDKLAEVKPLPVAQENICAGCLKPIRERYLLAALDKRWHEDCLKCACCDCRLGEVGSSLFTHSDKILCRRDFLRIFGQQGQCAACKKTIPPYELVMRANELAYHMDCFACQQCQYRFCVGDRYHLSDRHRILCLLCHADRQSAASTTSTTSNNPPNVATSSSSSSTSNPSSLLEAAASLTGRDTPPHQALQEQHSRTTA